MSVNAPDCEKARNALASDGVDVRSAGNDGPQLLRKVFTKLVELERIPSTASKIHHQAPEFGARVDLRGYLQSIARENSFNLHEKRSG